MQQNLRLFLWLGLALAIWLNVEAWLEDYGKPETSGAPTATTTAGAAGIAAPAPSGPSAPCSSIGFAATCIDSPSRILHSALGRHHCALSR